MCHHFWQMIDKGIFMGTESNYDICWAKRILKWLELAKIQYHHITTTISKSHNHFPFWQNKVSVSIYFLFMFSCVLCIFKIKVKIRFEENTCLLCLKTRLLRLPFSIAKLSTVEHWKKKPKARYVLIQKYYISLCLRIWTKCF